MNQVVISIKFDLFKENGSVGNLFSFQVDLLAVFVKNGCGQFWNSKENVRILPKQQCQTKSQQPRYRQDKQLIKELLYRQKWVPCRHKHICTLMHIHIYIHKHLCIYINTYIYMHTIYIQNIHTLTGKQNINEYTQYTHIYANILNL